MPQPDPPASSSLARAVLFLAFLFALLPLCVFPVSDTDTWWHLATGKRILETRSIPDADPFSFTVAGHPWVTHEWLAQLAGYATVAAGGLTGLILLKAAIVVAAFGILAALAVRRGAPAAPVLLLLLLAASLSADRYTERPQVASLLLFAGFLSVLLDFRDLGRDRLLLLPPLTALWANLHSGFVFGLALTGIFLADAVIRRAGVRRMAVVFALCLVAAMLNPNGVHSLLYPLEILRNPLYRTVTAEYQPIHLADVTAHTHVAVFAAMIGLGILAAVVARGTKGTWAPLPAFLFLLFGAAALKANRNRELFAVAAVPLLVEPFCSAPRRIAGGLGERIRRGASGRAFAAVAALALIACGAHGMLRGVRISEGYRRPVGFGAGPGVPAAATDFVRSAGLAGNPFHEMRFGGWLIWTLFPDHRVYIDGRQLLYGKPVFDEYVRILRHGPGFAELTAERGIQWTMLRNPAVWRNAAGDDAFPPLAAALGEDPEWGLVYFDELVVIHARRTPANEDALRRYELRAIAPLAATRLADGVDPVADRDEVLAEARSLIARSPRDGFVRLVAATAAGETGDSTTALPIFRELTAGAGGRHGAQAREALHQLGRDLLRGERGEDALAYLRLSRSVSPGDVGVRNDLGVALAIAGDLESARAEWEEALALDPDNEDARDNLARLRSAGETER